MRQVRVVLTCDEGFVADSLRDFATAYEDREGDWFEVEHGSGFLEFVEVPEPSLADIFDKKKEKVLDEREQERLRLQKMDEEERAWIEATLPKLEFLKARGFKVEKYFGGIVNRWPYNYIRIYKKGTMNCWVEIEGSTVRRNDGTISHLSPIIYNTEVLTLEGLVKRVAEW